MRLDCLTIEELLRLADESDSDLVKELAVRLEKRWYGQADETL